MILCSVVWYSVNLCCGCFFFFFKQKTAYEMRISDWSSDVCSSDLPLFGEVADRSRIERFEEQADRLILRIVGGQARCLAQNGGGAIQQGAIDLGQFEIGLDGIDDRVARRRLDDQPSMDSAPHPRGAMPFELAHRLAHGCARNSETDR